ncbi:GNAT family N-acetyltransferase [Roseovarius sp. M141]|uniref:GNAT family N-acetyltransferase n=1 Tax=Roseovarius sp. M141 TaxID=2583806 RepID=UPI0020CD2916|nr:GNAT family N-acetyltransferase [Roseovarius sp. M141]MCQ0092052.1 GNAT family N-acetyltransferase [Roseovarius sp. M141]
MSAAEDLARLHGRAFAGQGRGWRADEFADLLASPLTCLCAGPHGFALSRVIADEAELLTLATDPNHRRQGVAAALLAAVEGDVAARGAARHFLEVAADNTAARALYARAGYVPTGQRAGYYARIDGARVDALLMEKALHG